MSRWTFADPSTSESYTFLVNPNADGTPVVKKTVSPLALTAIDGVHVLFEGRSAPSTIEWSGVILDEAQYSNTVTWFGRRHQLEVTDDLARTTSIYITDFTTKRGAHSHHPWRMTYTVKAVLLSNQMQNLIDAQDSDFELGGGTWAIVSGFTGIDSHSTDVYGTIWPPFGTHSLHVVSSTTAGDNVIRMATIPVAPSTLYRLRMKVYSPTPTDRLGPLPDHGGAYAYRGRTVTASVTWEYTPSGGGLGTISTVSFSAPLSGSDTTYVAGDVFLTGVQVVGGRLASPPMPTGGTNMVARLDFDYITQIYNGSYQGVGFTVSVPIPSDNVYIDTVQFSR